ncbi:MAG: prolipoprotein diacylglyceryl transferase [Thermoanaerobaculia bacterium]|nr:prolipoprotein diacylglyceryl transferase [Thermoanaerobaculia bacterium]
MIEELFSIGPFAITPFGLMLVAGLLAGYWQLQRGMKILGIGDEDDASSIVFACGFLGILGGKIYYAVLTMDPGSLLSRAGIVWYGCLIGGFVGLMLVLRMRQLPVGLTFDATAPGLALGYSVGRVGCLLVGDDYGVPTDLPWAMEFPVGLPPTTAGNLRDFGVDVPASVPDYQLMAVHPTQIYSSLAAFAIFLVAQRLLRSGNFRPGGLFLNVLAMLSVERFFVEFIRAKDDRFLGSFTVAQLISVIILAILGVLWLRRRRSSTPTVAESSR